MQLNVRELRMHAHGVCSFFQDDVPCTSIFVREFPQDVTPEKLEEAFSRFGKVSALPAAVMTFLIGHYSFLCIQILPSHLE